MIFTVYGLRIRGEIEARYIGQTGATPEGRLRFRICEARLMPRPTSFAEWLVEHQDQIEAFPIETATSRKQARQLEWAAIQVCLSLNHRLFNRQLVPAAARMPRQGLAA